MERVKTAFARAVERVVRSIPEGGDVDLWRRG